MIDSEPYRRDAQLERLREGRPFDMLVIGGGATGAGVAVDAAARGYRVALCEQHDFGKGTSSRSTKLIHGGVRYLQQGNVGLVRDALHERGRLLANAAHLVYPLPTIVPLYRWWEGPYYRLGLWGYDLLAGRARLGATAWLSRERAMAELPTINPAGFRGGVRYFDAGFDDARLLVNMVQTAIDLGGVCANYARVAELVKDRGKVVGATAVDVETGASLRIGAKVVINAAGPFSDAVRRLDDPAADAWIAPSQGAHVVLERRFLPGDAALIVPKTSDGRVVFAIPWHEHTLVGTTDVPQVQVALEPRPLAAEIEFLLSTIGRYLRDPPQHSDVLSAFAGLRPLIRAGGSRATSKLARDHQVRIADSGLASIIGGKWTSYRRMAADAVDRAAEVGGLPRVACSTAALPLHGSGGPPVAGPLGCYGSDAPGVERLIASDAAYADRLDAELPYTAGEVAWAVRRELARTVEDVLARRLRALMLNARAATRSAPRVAQIVAAELGYDAAWVRDEVERFSALARGYLPESDAAARSSS